MQATLSALSDRAKHAIEQANDLGELNDLRVQFLGKKGELTQLLKSVSSIPPAERPLIGKIVNELKSELNQLIAERAKTLREIALNQRLEKEKIDITLPGRAQSSGSLHPVTHVTERMIGLLKSVGFSVAEGPEIEDVYHNFDALNFESYHPARAAIDTFYVDDQHLLRTHTSPVQIRVMKNQKPPFNIITPGRVYRRDSDQTHTPMFHQMEGLVVDQHTTFADLKSLLQTLMQRFFEKELALRFRPSYFPFTEPSAEVDIQCVICEGKAKDCPVCKGTGWLEVLGCGMVHPNVLKNVDIDPDQFTGFAFGMGLDRLAMLYYRIPDLRILFENDVRFLSQF